MMEEKPRDVLERQREHQRHAAILQQPRPQEDQDYTEEREMRYIHMEDVAERDHDSIEDHEQNQHYSDRSPGDIAGIYRKTLCPVPLNDRDPFDFDRETGQRVLVF